tara:strand:- start:504 stop:1388 length:885 start_codon:yes stop_codon:yes gene_type:complete
MKLKTLSAAILLSCSTTAFAQHHDDGHGHAAHMGPVVSCTDMATPPWAGLPDGDRQQVATLQQELAHLNTPEAAKAAGFNPVLGDIPGMGVHYINVPLAMRGTNLDVNTPDQLLFSQDQLVGAAYSFTDVPDTQVPLPFDSDLATWHDHPQFAADGQTLHMLHVWFVPSSNGPFAGLNFWLPYQTAGVEIPNPCWMADEDDADRIRKVSFALVDQEVERIEMLAALDTAASADDRDAWVTAADRFIADLSSREVAQVQGLLGVLGQNQMSSAERDAAGIAQPSRGPRRIPDAIE